MATKTVEWTNWLLKLFAEYPGEDLDIMDIQGYPDRDILVVPRISGQGRRGRSQDVPDILGYPDRDIFEGSVFDRDSFESELYISYDYDIYPTEL